jgi:hypothetical protein
MLIITKRKILGEKHARMPGPDGILTTMNEMAGLGKLAFLGFHQLSQKFGNIVRCQSFIFKQTSYYISICIGET